VTIDSYLAALGRALPRSARLRALPEIREHLRDAAARHREAGRSRFDAEAAATKEFGPVAEVARRIGTELAIRETRIATALALAAVAFFVFPLHVVPESTLPPAPWAEMPTDLLVLQRVAIAFWVFAGAFAGLSVVLAWTRFTSYTARLLALAAVSMASSAAVSAALVARWFSYTPATPSWGFAVPLAVACLVACAFTARWARSSRARLLAIE
jgi:hypothetical protein